MMDNMINKCIKGIYIISVLWILFLAGGVSAATLYINGSNNGINATEDGNTAATGWNTIQKGITAANAGDTVYIAPKGPEGFLGNLTLIEWGLTPMYFPLNLTPLNNTYIEKGVIVDKPLNIIGMDRDSTIMYGKGLFIRGFEVRADNVNISNLTFTHYHKPRGPLVYYNTANGNVFNISVYFSQFGARFDNSTNVHLWDSYFYTIYVAGVIVWSTNDSLFERLTIYHSGQIYTDANSFKFKWSNYNTVRNVKSMNLLGGILLQNSSGNLIESSSFTGRAKIGAQDMSQEFGIGIFGGYSYNNIIADSIFNSSRVTGISVGMDATNNTITSNYFSDNYRGFYSSTNLFYVTSAVCWVGWGMDCYTDPSNSIIYNSFTNNVYGAIQEGPSSFDLSNNYWGSTDGPSGTGDNVSVNIGHMPFLTNNKSIDHDKSITFSRSYFTGIVDMKDALNMEVEFKVSAPVNITTSWMSKYYVKGILARPFEESKVHNLSIAYTTFDIVYGNIYDNDDDIHDLELRYYYTNEDLSDTNRNPKNILESTISAFWYDPSAGEYVMCNASTLNTVDTGNYSGYISLRLNSTTSPSIKDLDGVFYFGGMEVPPPKPIPPTPSSSGGYIKMNVSNVSVEVINLSKSIVGGETLKISLTILSGLYERNGATIRLLDLPEGWISSEIWTGALIGGLNEEAIFVTIPKDAMGVYTLLLEIVPKDFYGTSRVDINVTVNMKEVITKEIVYLEPVETSSPPMTKAPKPPVKVVVPSPSSKATPEEKGICGPTLIAGLVLAPVVLRRKRGI